MSDSSDIRSIISADDVKLLTDNPEAVKVVDEYGLAAGTNPLHYLNPQ